MNLWKAVAFALGIGWAIGYPGGLLLGWAIWG